MRRLAALLAVLVASPAAADEEIALGRPAPAFTLRALNPEVAGAPMVSLDRYVGPEAEDAAAKLVLLTFFASWCEPCARELPLLVQLDRRYRAAGLRVLAVSIDREEPEIDAARRLTEAANVAYPVLSDRFNFLARRYLGEQAPLPSVFLVREDGTLARIERGYAKDGSAFLVAAVEAELGVEPTPAVVTAAPPAPSAKPLASKPAVKAAPVKKPARATSPRSPRALRLRSPWAEGRSLEVEGLSASDVEWRGAGGVEGATRSLRRGRRTGTQRPA
jgi:thiol-disulfide isomerase/thioredoxin